MILDFSVWEGIPKAIQYLLLPWIDNYHLREQKVKYGKQATAGCSCSQLILPFRVPDAGKKHECLAQGPNSSWYLTVLRLKDSILPKEDLHLEQRLHNEYLYLWITFSYYWLRKLNNAGCLIVDFSSWNTSLNKSGISQRSSHTNGFKRTFFS